MTVQGTWRFFSGKRGRLASTLSASRGETPVATFGERSFCSYRECGVLFRGKRGRSASTQSALLGDTPDAAFVIVVRRPRRISPTSTANGILPLPSAQGAPSELRLCHGHVRFPLQQKVTFFLGSSVTLIFSGSFFAVESAAKPPVKPAARPALNQASLVRGSRASPEVFGTPVVTLEKVEVVMASVIPRGPQKFMTLPEERQT